MKLSKRLEEIANFVDQGDIVADIGTDHGYVPVYLINKGISPKVIASDVSKGSLYKAIDYIEDLSLDDRIDTRLGSGLEVLDMGEVDTAIIGGMGGILIIEILEKNRDLTKSIDKFIFQPMLASEKLREYLILNKFDIIDESIIKEDGKFYEIIKAERSNSLKKLEDPIYLEISEILLEEKDPVLKEFLNFKISYNESIIERISRETSSKVSERLKELEDKNNSYKEVLKNYEGN